MDINYGKHGAKIGYRKKFPGLLEIAGERIKKGEMELKKKREWSSGHAWDFPNLELRALFDGLISPILPHVTIQPRHQYTSNVYKTIAWICLVAFILPSSWRLSPLVGWSHVDDLHRMFIPHCWINGQMCDRYAFMLKVRVAFSPPPFFIY